MIPNSQILLKLTQNNLDRVISVLGQEYIDVYTPGEPMTVQNATVLPPSLIRFKNSPKTYLADSENKALRHIPSLAIFYSYNFSFKNVSVVEPQDLTFSTYKEFEPLSHLLPREGALIKSLDSPNIYIVQNGQKRHIKSFNIFTAYGFNLKNVIIQSKEVIDSYQISKTSLEKTGETLPGISKEEKKTITPIVPSAPAVIYPDGMLLQGSGVTTYFIEYGKKRPFHSFSVFELLGYKRANVKKINDKELEAIPTGSLLTHVLKHPNGTLVREAGGTKVYIIENDKLKHLTLDEFKTKKYNLGQVITVSEKEFQGY